MFNTLITGVSGQAGAVLAKLLLDSGHNIFGMVRQSSSRSFWRLKELDILDKIILLEGDVTDQGSLDRIFSNNHFEYCFHTAAQSYVKISWDQPITTADITGLGTLRVLEAIRKHSKSTKMLNFSSSEMFGKVQETPQTEMTPFYPRSPYGCAKVFAFDTCKNYRESHSLWCCSGIFFNYESEYRSEEFVTRVITKGIAEILAGKREKIQLGNLSAKRDWTYAKDSMRAAKLMLENDVPEDYVISSGKTRPVSEFLETACAVAGLSAEDVVEFDETRIRRAEVDLLLGDSSHIKYDLGWETTTPFNQLVETMVLADCKRLGVTLANKYQIAV